MKKFFRAQSTLEFIMIIILVLTGIFVMGPYVIRSVNAYMHSWEISAEQARNNPNVQLNPWEMPGGPPPPPTCATDCSACDENECDNEAPRCMVLEYFQDIGGACVLGPFHCADRDPSGCLKFTGNTCCDADPSCEAHCP